MIKTLFTTESEINATPKALYPFISSASLLSKWFADDVLSEEEEGGIFTFVWDEVKYPAKIVAKKENHFVKFEFLDQDNEEPSWIQFRIEVNQLTNATYLIIEDYSEIDNPHDFEEMYNNNFSALSEALGNTQVE